MGVLMVQQGLNDPIEMSTQQIQVQQMPAFKTPQFSKGQELTDESALPSYLTVSWMHRANRQTVVTPHGDISPTCNILCDTDRQQ
jgi:hypothetical protein